MPDLAPKSRLDVKNFWLPECQPACKRRNPSPSGRKRRVPELTHKAARALPRAANEDMRMAKADVKLTPAALEHLHAFLDTVLNRKIVHLYAIDPAGSSPKGYIGTDLAEIEKW